mmetsp:Transcript_23529/g.34183  ORF Transcript_23529/g.34183 Transcript_23529/m.34183 type:complete len:535 (-) Transcript_23529:208-1812(-)
MANDAKEVNKGSTDESKGPKDESKDGLVSYPTEVSIEDLRRVVGLIVRAVDEAQSRLLGRAMRMTTPLRTRMTPSKLKEGLGQLLPDNLAIKAQLVKVLSSLPDPPQKDTPVKGEGEAEKKGEGEGVDTPPPPPPPGPPASVLPEVEIFLGVLVLSMALRLTKSGEGAEDAVMGGQNEVQPPPAPVTELAVALLERSKAFNRRSMDPLTAKLYFYFAMCFERSGQLIDIKPLLLSLHRTCCLRHDEQGQAVLLNLVLRGLLQRQMVDQADKLASNTTFPEHASHNQFCRYLYYMGRLHAIQLDYSDAHTKLSQSLRKAPTNTARGFRIAVQKLLVIVQLLMGEIPERTAFSQKGMREALAPYLRLTQAVRLGDLLEFKKVVQANAQTFKLDKTDTLIQRLSHNVVKLGLSKINLSYSRISLADICKKLHLANPQSAEFVCAKAIKDGVIEATVDHENGWLSSQETADIYSTSEPQQVFHRRITFCLDIHNEAVKAMRYPPNAYKKELDEVLKKDDEKTEEELAKEIEDEMDEDF